MAIDYTTEQPNKYETVYTWPDLTSTDVTAAVPIWPARRMMWQVTVHDQKGPVTLQVSEDGTNWASAQERAGNDVYILGAQESDANLRIYDLQPARFARVLCDTTEAACVLVVRRDPEVAS